MMINEYRQSLRMLELPEKSNTFVESGMRQCLFSNESESVRLSEDFHSKCINNHKHVPLCRIEARVSLEKDTRKKSILSSTNSLMDLYSDVPGVEKFKDEKQDFKILNLNLTWVFGNADLSMTLVGSILALFLLVRYLSFACTIYYTLAIDLNLWEIFTLLGVTSLLYCVCMVKISLKPAETGTEIVLKAAFDSLQNSNSFSLFEVVSKPRLCKCLLRGVVPPQLSFLFIGSRDPFRRKRIYLMVNYIYCSIEAVIYFPGFLIYYFMSYRQQQAEKIDIVYFIINVLVFMTWVTFLVFNGYLFFLANKDHNHQLLKSD